MPQFVRTQLESLWKKSFTFRMFSEPLPLPRPVAVHVAQDLYIISQHVQYPLYTKFLYDVMLLV